MLFFMLNIVSKALTVLLFSLLKLRRKVVLSNLDLAFANSLSTAEKERVAFSSTASFLLTIFEFLMSEHLFRKTTVTFPRLQVVTEALKEGRGVYIATIHQGNWELMCFAANRTLNCPIHVAVKPIGGPVLSKWIRKRRACNGLLEIPRDSSRPAWQLIYDAMRKNELVAFMVDQARRKGVKVPFFGHPASTSNSIFRMWLGHNAPIIPCAVHRVKGNIHVVDILDPFEVETNPAWSENEFYIQNTAKLNSVIETFIRNHPEQYFWLHKRWK